MIRFHHIVVAVDFEDSSKQALAVAVDMALTFDARLSIFHAWELQPYSYGGVYLAPDLGTVIEEAAKKLLATTLDGIVKRLPKAESVLANGPAAFEILAAVGRLKADLIVMGTHGRHGLSRMILGSVADKVVRASPVPVLTIRAAGHPPAHG